MNGKYILALDEGSSSARAILVDHEGRIAADASEEFSAIYPRPGWVELSPAILWEAMHNSITRAMNAISAKASDITAVGITSHRETAMIWDRKTGEPVYNAIMWMSKQTDEIVSGWSDRGLDGVFKQSTGLRNDSFFSAGKLAWLFENVEGLKKRAEKGDLAAGTVDTWLLWKMTGGKTHATDRSCASRTALLDLSKGDWNHELLNEIDLPDSILPEIKSSFGEFGTVAEGVLPGLLTHSIPVAAVLGDQMAGLFGQLCWEKGGAKNSYGTAGVLTVNIGSEPILLEGMNTSFAWDLNGEFSYESEGVVFFSGKTIQFLRDNLGLISNASEAASMAASVEDTGGVYFVPAFAGLGDPYWDRNARGAIMGLQLDTTKEQIVRAGLESLAYQTMDNFNLLSSTAFALDSLKVDGGAVKNDWLCQFQADILGVEVQRPKEVERTAIGVAQAAGLAVGLWTKNDLRGQWDLDRVFEPNMNEGKRQHLIAGWKDAVEATRSLPPKIAV